MFRGPGFVGTHGGRADLAAINSKRAAGKSKRFLRPIVLFMPFVAYHAPNVHNFPSTTNSRISYGN